MGDKTEVIRTSVEEKIDRFSEGVLGHATEMISALWKVANQDENITAPPSTSPAVSPFPSLHPSLRDTAMLTLNDQAAVVTSPAHWVAVKTALIRSIRQGIFFDREYWARHSRAGDVLKPVYFSGAIIEDKVHQLNKSASSCGWQIR